MLQWIYIYKDNKTGKCGLQLSRLEKTIIFLRILLIYYFIMSSIVPSTQSGLPCERIIMEKNKSQSPILSTLSQIL